MLKKYYYILIKDILLVRLAGACISGFQQSGRERLCVEKMYPDC